jgi:hypothetical protein
VLREQALECRNVASVDSGDSLPKQSVQLGVVHGASGLPGTERQTAPTAIAERREFGHIEVRALLKRYPHARSLAPHRPVLDHEAHIDEGPFQRMGTQAKLAGHSTGGCRSHHSGVVGME